MTTMPFPRDPEEAARIRVIAQSGSDFPVLMLNLNRYTARADFPHGEIYAAYMAVLEAFLPVVGAKILWRAPVHGHPVGDQVIHEVLGAWYPSHQAFLDLPSAPGAEENYRLRGLAVEYACSHRCTGESPPFAPG
jgi:hypothetical protein